MTTLRFSGSQDGVKRATVKIEFRAGLDTLETAVVFAYEHTDPEAALPAIAQLSKAKVVELVEDLLKAKGNSYEFVGESTSKAVIAAAEKRVQELWPQLTTGLPLSQILPE